MSAPQGVEFSACLDSEVVAKIHELMLDGTGDGDGDVESPVGWFGRLDIEAGQAYGHLHGHWLLGVDNQGFKEATNFADKAVRDEIYNLLAEAYTIWVGDDEQ